MDTRLRISGHPIQPVLMTFPVGLFVCAVVFDVGRLVGAPAIVGEVGYWTAVAGLVATALTMVAGMVDLWDVPAGPVRRDVITFNAVNAAMAGIFLVVCLMRAGSGHPLASVPMVVMEGLALAVGGLGIWLGAGLMRRFGTMAGDRSVPRGRRLVATPDTVGSGTVYATNRAANRAGLGSPQSVPSDPELTAEMRLGLGGLSGLAAERRNPA
ncbi:hypothetical protein Ais01nite_55620 [Asanoa ishikariensis]|uniref:Uncharacterized membrane protein n=1 Tax=Asanoa ishikariensis TaxID=137265 RepID=A0A1H3TW46_9ACTN|nr:hypothetical protein Ais01nite_55620 [Asanoa ishikariensis]SDZ53925.1 Uncharacterized membrane protein [Asanoa ishikariensis]